MDGRLYRSRRDRMLAGVAGGLAELWGADPSLVRIIWALLVLFTGGLALIVYLVMAVVVPEEDDAWLAGTPPDPATAGFADVSGAVPPAPAGTGPDAQAWAAADAANRAAWAERRAARAAHRAEHRGRGSANGALIGGTLLILIGVFFLAREYLPTIDFDWFWPLALVAFGVLLLVSALRRDDRGDRPGGAA